MNASICLIHCAIFISSLNTPGELHLYGLETEFVVYLRRETRVVETIFVVVDALNCVS